MVVKKPSRSLNSSRYRQGLFVPKHPHKYEGDVNNIMYMSSYELEMCTFLDLNPNVLKWSSEEIIIPYFNPVKQKMSRYYPDFFVTFVNSSGKVINELIEIKPHNQTKAPRTRKGKHHIYENLTYAINCAKWEAASKYCTERGWNFRIITQKSLNK